MSLENQRLEIERIENLIGNFGWTIVKQELIENKVVVTISRDAEPPEVELSAGSS